MMGSTTMEKGAANRFWRCRHCNQYLRVVWSEIYDYAALTVRGIASVDVAIGESCGIEMGSGGTSS